MPFDRYEFSRENTNFKPLPFVKIPQQSTDKYVLFMNGDRFDKLAFKYYNDPTLNWVIALANPEKSLEFDYNVGDQIRIPFPLQSVLNAYDEQVLAYYNQ